MRRLSRRRTARYESSSFLVDGPTLLAEAVDAGVTLDHVYVETDQLGHAALSSLPVGVPVSEVAVGALSKVLDVVTPNGMVAVAQMGEAVLDDVLDAAVRRNGPVLVLVDVADPGNVGTMIRTAEAAGCLGVVIAGETADPYAPKVVRASAGSLFRLPVCVIGDIDWMLSRAREHPIDVVGTVLGDGVAPEDLVLDAGFVLLMGNEAHGLSGDVMDVCDRVLSIPMEGSVESLNVAMAATVVLFEAARQRRSSRSSDR